MFLSLYRQELTNIGFCLGSFIFACPFKFLHGQGIGGMSLSNLINVLEKAVKPDTTCGNTHYVVEVIIPMTFRYPWLPLYTYKAFKELINFALFTKYRSLVTDVYFLHL